MKKPAFDPTKPAEAIKPVFDPSQPFEPIDLEGGSGGLAQAETFARSVAEGVTAGASEPVVSGATAVIGELIDRGFDPDLLKQFWSVSVDRAAIERIGQPVMAKYEADIARRKALEAEFAKTALAGEVLGAMTPIGAPARIAKAAGGAVKGLSAIPAVGGIAKGAAEAALGGVASEALKQTVQEATGVMEPGEGPALGDVAALGGKLGAGIAAVPVVGKALAAAAPRVMSAFGGVPPQVISDYLKRAAPSESVSSGRMREAVDVAAQNMQDALLQNRTQTADDLMAAVTALKQKVIAGSEEAFNILEAVSATNKKAFVPFQAIQKTVNQSINELRRGAEALTPIRETAASYMENLLERFQTRAVKGRIDLVTAKEMIQAIDEVKKVATSAGQFSGSLDVALGALRSTIDKSVKMQVPQYGEKMLEVAANTRLLGVANDFFGEGKKALSNVERLVIGTDPYLASAAKQLEEVTGVQISKGIESVKTLKPARSIMPDNTETFVKAVLGGKSPRAQQQLRVLADFTEENLLQLSENAQLTRQFGSLVQNGSRDVVFWKELLGATAPYVAAGTAFGGPLGAVVGFMVKTYGAPATKIVLDGMLRVKGLPTVRKIEQALSNAPEPVRRDLMNGFIRANILRMDPSEPQTMLVDPSEVPGLYQEIKNSDLDAVTKANSMRSLSQDGSIPVSVVKKLMANMGPPKRTIKPPVEKRSLEADRPERLRR